MKRTVPLLIVFISGMVMICSHFIPPAVTWKEDVAVWFDILAAIAFVLGGGNLLKMNLQKISNQKPGWGYAAVVLIAFVVTLVIGMVKLGSPPAEKMEQHGWSMAHLSLEGFPQTFDIKGVLPEGEVPPVVKGQLTKKTEEEISFHGWMRSNQLAALKKFEMEKKWHDMLITLSKKAQPPETLIGRINFNAQLHSLTFKGVMSNEDQERLIAMGTNAEWQRAIKQLHAFSNKTYEVPLRALPEGVSIPEKLNDIVQFDADSKTLSQTGPMSNEQREALLAVFPIAEALTDVEKMEIEQKLISLGKLSPSQKVMLNNFNQGATSAGERGKQLFFWLVTSSPQEEHPQLNQAQKTYLMSNFNERNAPWMSKVNALYVASHQTKYSWSGDYKAQGSGIWYIFQYGLVPLTATMFALLAFYVASAAFRAFRAKNIEATLLLGTAFIVLLGNTYAGTFLSVEINESLFGRVTPSWLRMSTWKDFIMMVFNTAGNRAIMIGIALGIASTSLKVLLGIDRSYLGSD